MNYGVPEDRGIAALRLANADILPFEYSRYAAEVSGEARRKSPGVTGAFSSCSEWRAIQDSNLWPSAPEADALSS